MAALSVMMFHASLQAGWRFQAGPTGVDVFFVISGFIMASILEARPMSPGRFLAGRLIRIVPAYWAVTLAMVAVSQIAPRVFPNMQPTTLHVIGSLLFVQRTDPEGQPFPLLAAGWTLNYEMFFYLLFAACLLLPKPARFPALIGILTTLAAAGRVVEFESPVLRCFTSPMLLEFAAGVCLAEAARRHVLPSWRIGAAAMAVGAAAFVIEHFLPPDVSSDMRLLMWGLPGTLLVGGAVSFERQHHAPVVPILLQLGPHPMRSTWCMGWQFRRFHARRTRFLSRCSWLRVPCFQSP